MALAVSLIASGGISLAQTPPAPQPSPTPGPAPTRESDNPYESGSLDSAVHPKPPEPASASQQDDPYNPKPYDFASHPPKPVFKSPFPNKDKPGPGEAAAFSDLVSLYDKMQAAGDATAKARACGSAQDVKKAQDAQDIAGHAYQGAVDQYVKDYSDFGYPPDIKGLKGEALKSFSVDGLDVTVAVTKASKYVHAPIQACPPLRQDTTGKPAPAPEPGPPAKSALEEILGHVSIGVGVGIGGDRRDRRDRDDDRRRDDDRVRPLLDRR